MENKNKIQQLHSVEETLNYSISVHLNQLKNWITGGAILSSIENPLGINSFIKRHLLIENEIRKESIQIEQDILIKSAFNYQIIGAPGIGKTSMIKTLIHQMLFAEERQIYGIPLLIRVREISGGGLFESIKNIFGLDIMDVKKIIEILSKGKFILFIDGLDEINPADTELFISELSILYRNIQNSKVLSTTRRQFQLPNCTNCEIFPLNQKEIYDLLKIDLSQEQLKDIMENSLISKFMTNPLLLKVIVTTYKAYGKLPASPITIYKNVIDLFLNDWDKNNNIIRKIGISNIFPREWLKELLALLAYELLSSNKALFTREDLYSFLTDNKVRIRFRMENEDVAFIQEEITSNTGIIIEYEKSIYGFAHKSIQEFLAAEYLVRTVNIPMQTIFEKMPSVMALCILLSSNPIEFYMLIFEKVDFNDQTKQSFYTFFNTLFNNSDQEETKLFLLVLFGSNEYWSRKNMDTKELQKIAEEIAAQKL